MAYESEEYALEEVIDSVGLAQTVELLIAICYGKAEHLRTNWQDESAAKRWERDALTLDRIVGKLDATS